jgi:DNA-binding transcriptional MerR regulator
MTTPTGSRLGSNDKNLGKYTMAVAVMMTGVAPHKIRKFEEYGLCNPVRTGSKQRLYSDCDIEQIQKIAHLEKGGVNLAGIKVILGMTE